MTWSERNPGWAFAVRAGLLFALFLSPLPWLADTYATIHETVSNGVMFIADHDSRYGFRFEPPERIRARGSWMGVLRVEDRRSGQNARMTLDIRAFSYRPMATFLALALGARLAGRRKKVLVLGGGFALIVAVTSGITVIAALRFGIGRVLGFGYGPFTEAAYEALTTPAMAYVIPLVCFCLVFWLARNLPARKPACDPSAATAAVAER